MMIPPQPRTSLAPPPLVEIGAAEAARANSWFKLFYGLSLPATGFWLGTAALQFAAGPPLPWPIPPLVAIGGFVTSLGLITSYVKVAILTHRWDLHPKDEWRALPDIDETQNRGVRDLAWCVGRNSYSVDALMKHSGLAEGAFMRELLVLVMTGIITIDQKGVPLHNATFSLTPNGGVPRILSKLRDALPTIIRQSVGTPEGPDLPSSGLLLMPAGATVAMTNTWAQIEGMVAYVATREREAEQWSLRATRAPEPGAPFLSDIRQDGEQPTMFILPEPAYDGQEPLSAGQLPPRWSYSGRRIWLHPTVPSGGRALAEAYLAARPDPGRPDQERLRLSQAPPAQPVSPPLRQRHLFDR